ncbi:2',3'-cyclic-nucleotide 2'-phosphodiesterase/3'-nucleotidase [Rubricella aquisinus]|uniref:2',3'-cyclic-nucleotide 2'-phosphodiesterase/3'-nucleotidase n=1 Tax=Rubricella aquisinus TaxID=2028108 RepID=A0A840X8Z4_9RHOB|nr:5'-nucleotidase C-terminal domain-containing protein [Rubricella aquisinus]MBB5517197.1 2',3'-cyclic-nucleotide 2'-phosphodiesterase/3'-nucleotidase [Rubricella aquisinus]
MTKPHAPRNPIHTAHRLRLLVTSDLHMHLRPRDLLTGAEEARGLLALAGPIEAARAAGHATLLLDNGDFLQGTPMGEWHNRDGRAHPHPLIATMNALGFDASTLGNHEFDYGTEYLAEVLDQADFPILNCNLDITPALPTRPSLIVERDIGGVPLRIGITGTVPQRIMVWSRHLLKGRAMVTPPEQAVVEEAARLRAAGADLVICLAHAGIVPPGHPEEDSENGALRIAQTGAVDALICGHQHLSFPGDFLHDGAGIDATRGTLAGCPAIMPGWAGEVLGQLDLHLVHEAGAWRVTDHSARLIPCDPAAVPPALARLSDRAEEATTARLSKPLSHFPAPLETGFALVEDCTAMRLIHAAQIWALDLLLPQDAAGPRLSSVAAFRTGGRAGPDGFTRVPAGPLSLRAVADLYPYENGFTAVEVTGAVLRDWLEMSAGALSQLTPGQPRPLLRPGAPGFNFDMIAGVTYRIDLGHPAAFDLSGVQVAERGRVQELSYQGQPVTDDQRFIVATNSYRAAGGGRFPHLADQREVIATDRATASLLAAFLEAHPDGPPVPDRGWSLTAPPGAQALFDGDRTLSPRFSYPRAEMTGTRDGFGQWVFTF